MAAFFVDVVAMTEPTSVRIIESDSSDREVILFGNGCRFAFTEASLVDGLVVDNGTNATASSSGFRFVLPAREELWCDAFSSVSVSFMVTKAK